MIDRRLFLGSSAALGALGAIGVTGWQLNAARPGMTVLFDGLTPDGRQFAEGVRSEGIEPHDTGRDLAGLLYGPMRERFAGPSAILAGLTRYADFMVAEGIARERGMKALSPGHQDNTRLLERAAAMPREADSHFWIFSRHG